METKKLPCEVLNEFIDNNIAPIVKDHTTTVVNADNILDWMMQRNWIFGVHYTSWPDGKEHLAKDGLKEVFDAMQNVSKMVRNLQEVYNKELYRLYRLLDTTPNKEELEKLQTLEKIKALLK